MAGYPFVITSACLDVHDQSCVDVCPVQCIYEFDGSQMVARTPDDDDVEIRESRPEVVDQYGDRMLYIHPDECIACSACVPVCPVEAIFPEDQVPAADATFVDVNRRVFAEL